MKAGPGRPKGSRNKATDVQVSLVEAFNRCMTSADWDALVRKGRALAMKGRPDLLKAMLPYVAKKQPVALEGADGGPITVKIVHFGEKG